MCRDEALAQRTPARALARVDLERLPCPECPPHWERREAFRNGSLKFQRRQPKLSGALAAEPAELVEVEEQLQQTYFRNHGGAVLEATLRKLRGVVSADRLAEAVQAVLEAAEVQPTNSIQ